MTADQAHAVTEARWDRDSAGVAVYGGCADELFQM